MHLRKKLTLNYYFTQRHVPMHKGSFSRGLLHFPSKGNEANKACVTPCAFWIW